MNLIRLYPSRFFPNSLHFLMISGIILISIAMTGTVYADNWQQISSPGWVQVDIPTGWTNEAMSMGEDNKSATLTTGSPDGNTDLVYILDHSSSGMTVDEMKSFQDSWMQGEGFRICKTHDPVQRTKADHISLKQVYVQGSDKGAVMFSASYPEWGVYHVALLMEGAAAVQQYYDSLPPQFEDHIVPVIEKEEIGTITFTKGTKASE